MGTFHRDKGELHGITVVVDCGARVYVGRCDERTPEGIILLDVDQFDEGDGGRTKAQYLDFAARYGIFKKHDRVVVPAAEIGSVTRLGDLAR